VHQYKFWPNLLWNNLTWSNSIEFAFKFPKKHLWMEGRKQGSHNECLNMPTGFLWSQSARTIHFRSPSRTYFGFPESRQHLVYVSHIRFSLLCLPENHIYLVRKPGRITCFMTHYALGYYIRVCMYIYVCMYQNLPRHDLVISYAIFLFVVCENINSCQSI